MEVQIAPYYSQLIQNNLASGKYNNESEIIQAGLELLDKEQKQMSLLERALLEGERSGFATPFNNEDFKKRMTEKYALKK